MARGMCLWHGTQLTHCTQDTDYFCRETLCNPEVVEYVNNNFLCWGGDIRYTDTFRVMQPSMLQHGKYRTKLTQGYVSSAFSCWSKKVACRCLDLGYNF